MKTKLIITVFLFIGIVSNIFAQKIDYSAYLAPSGGVHTWTASVVDKDGNIFVATCMREGLKVTEDAFQKNYKGHTKDDVTGGDGILMKLSPKGELLYSTYIGGTGSDGYCHTVTLDDFGNIYIGFLTESKDLPVSKNAYQKSHKGGNDHYIVKFSNDCKYIASTYLGGSDGDSRTMLKVHNNTLYLFGNTNSNDFPTTGKAFQKQRDNSIPIDTTQPWLSSDLTITALSLNLDKILYSTYFVGKSLDYIDSYSFDLEGKIIIVGNARSQDFPITKNAYQKSMVGETEGFFTIINQDLSKIEYSTFIGGDSTDQVNSIFVEDEDNIILIGETKSPNFPITQDAANKKYLGGSLDGFITRFNLKTNKPVYSSFIGGLKRDQLKQIIKTEKQKYVLVSVSNSNDFPITQDAINKTLDGGNELVISILDETLKNIEYSTFVRATKGGIMSPIASYVKGGKLVVSAHCFPAHFPATLTHTEPDRSSKNCLWQFDLNNK